MDNLPAELEPIKAYYYSNFTVRLNMYEGYSPSGPITMDVLTWGKALYTINGAYNPAIRQISLVLSQEQIQSLPPVADVKIKDGGATIFTGTVKPTKEGQPSDEVGYSVSVGGDQLVVVEFSSASLIETLMQTTFQSRPTRVPTFAEMLSTVEPGISRQFVVEDDEYQEDENVPYTWDGMVLLEYGISLCDIQPDI